MAKNDYLARKAIERQTYLDIGMEVGFQKAVDIYEICLNDPSVMGKDTFGRGRIDNLRTAAIQRDKYYDLAFTDDVEADVRRAEMDAELRRIYGKDLVPYEGRYPAINKTNYKNGKKAWR